MRAVIDVKSTHDLHLLRVEDILKNFEPAYGGSWEGAKASLLKSSSDAEVIKELRAYIRENAFFKEPVVLDLEEHAVSNGMHRIISSWLEGRDTILVSYGYLEDKNMRWCEVELKVTLPPEHPARCEEWGELEFLSDEFRSWPHQDFWMQCDFFSTHGRDTYYGVWAWDPEDADTLKEIILERGRTLGCELEVVSIKENILDEDF